MSYEHHLQAVIDIAVAAGAQILAVYEQAGSPAVTLKADDSPITEADRRAHELIVAHLRSLTPDIPVLSEESVVTDFAVRQSWHTYWLVDPLDGTREFVKRNGEFTVNIALIENGRAVLGVVHVPVSGSTYSGKVGAGAWVQHRGAGKLAISASPMPIDADRLRVVASRSHRDAALDAVIATVRTAFSDVSEVSMGSSLKMCLLAEGKADLYPRLAPTCEWDTAAAHAILCAAGGEIVNLQFEPLQYNQKESLLNPYFLALADPGYDWRSLLQESLQLDKPQ